MGMLSDFLTLIKGTQTNIDGVLQGKNGKIVGVPVNAGNDSLVTKDHTVGVFSNSIAKNSSKTFTTTAGSDLVFFTFAPASASQGIWQLFTTSVGGQIISEDVTIEGITFSSSEAYKVTVTNDTNATVAVKALIFAGAIS